MAKAGELNAPKSLTALGDDAARHALSFLSVAECRRSVGASAKHFRALFPVEPSFPSSRFRIRLTNGFEHQCMHIRGFELFGAILPPWRIDA